MHYHALNVALFLTLLEMRDVTANVQHSDVIDLKKPKGEMQAYYDDSSRSPCCSAVVLLNVGTAMTVGAYSDLATSIVQHSSGTVTVVMDTNPGWIQKQDGGRYVQIANAIASNITKLVPDSCCKHQPRNGYFIGGHSGGGEGAVHALMMSKDLTFSVVGYIGLAPYNIQDRRRNRMSIEVSSLLWGFSQTTCAVCRQQAALAAYNVSPNSSRVFYDVQTNNYNPIFGGPHCSFTDNGCLWLCSGGTTFSWIREAVGDSVNRFTSAVIAGKPFQKEQLEIRPSDIKLYVNGDIAVTETAGEVKKNQRFIPSFKFT